MTLTSESYVNSLKDQHQCQLPREKDILEEFCPGSDNYSRLKRTLLRIISINGESFNTKLHLKSSSVIKGEILRHILFHPSTIHSFSKFRFVQFDFILILLLKLQFIQNHQIFLGKSYDNKLWIGIYFHSI